MSARHDPLHDLDRHWIEAETGGDTTTLDGLATDDFTLVGPAGFVLSKQQWLDRYRHGDLRTRALQFKAAATRSYSDTAVTIGRQVQQADYRGHPVNGQFRVTRVAVRDSSGWRLAGLHISPIADPSPGTVRAAR